MHPEASPRLRRVVASREGKTARMSRLVYVIAIAAVILAALLIRVFDPSPVARMRLMVFDAYQQLKPRVFDPSLPVRIVDIDEESLKRHGQWPWPRTKLAEITDRLRENGAAAIGFDIIFPEPDRLSPQNAISFWPAGDALDALRAEAAKLPSNDQVLVDAIARAPVVLGFIADGAQGVMPALRTGFAFGGDDPKQFAPAFDGAIASLPEMQEKATGSGALNWIPEYDQVTRRLPLLVSVGGGLYPSFAAENLRIGQGASTILARASNASGATAFGEQSGVTDVRIGDLEVPTEADGQMWIRFTRSDPRRFIPAWKLLAGEAERDSIDGNIVLIGTSAAGLHDRQATPLEASVPGVEVHAQGIEQMILGDFLNRPDFATPLELAAIATLGLLMAGLIWGLGAIGSAIVGVFALAAVLFGSWLGFVRYNWLFDPVYPALSVIAVFGVGTLITFLRTEGERNRVRNAFSHYMAPALVEQLAAEPDRLKLGGETRDMTLLFSDVRGFTGISEGLSAEELTRFINQLFTPLSDVILEERGTIDKFMGDAVMAFWNAPLDDPDHPVHACRAALRMANAIPALNETWREEAEAAGRAVKTVRIGIGLNSGECCVGNLGSEKRFDYSVIGDNVNVAARLEGQCKIYDVPIIAGETTAQRAPEFAFVELDLLRVKGRSAPTRIFALLGDSEFKSSQMHRTLEVRHGDMLSRFRARDWDGAEHALKLCETLDSGQLDRTYALYRERIRAFRQSPPPPEWDGSAEAEGK
jgi:adenylate cyclase